MGGKVPEAAKRKTKTRKLTLIVFSWAPEGGGGDIVPFNANISKSDCIFTEITHLE